MCQTNFVFCPEQCNRSHITSTKTQCSSRHWRQTSVYVEYTYNQKFERDKCSDRWSWNVWEPQSIKTPAQSIVPQYLYLCVQYAWYTYIIIWRYTFCCHLCSCLHMFAAYGIPSQSERNDCGMDRTPLYNPLQFRSKSSSPSKRHWHQTCCRLPLSKM